MATLLEAKYLGEGKPWESRGKDGTRKISGMPAHEVVYRGTGSNTRLIIARGKVNDYVFIFIASANAFKALELEFEWLLKNFKPNAEDFIRTEKQQLVHKNTKRETIRANRFAEPRYGYTIEYPAAWEMSKPANMTTMFSGRDGTPDYAAIVAIQNIRPPGASSPNEAAIQALNQLKTSLGAAVNKITILEDKEWTYRRAGKTLIGRQLLVSYKHQSVIFQKRLIAMPRSQGTVVHVWSYTAPKSQYVNLQPQVDRMLRSWKILEDIKI